MAKLKRFFSIVGMVAILGLVTWYWLRQDVITLVNTAGGDTPVVLLDGWRGSCLDDEVGRGKKIWVGNMTPDAGCSSEIAVFAKGNAMNFITSVTSWTADVGDVVSVMEQGLLDVPLHIWTLKGITNDGKIHAQHANDIYDAMQVGLRFAYTIHDFHTQTTVGVASCEDLTPLKDAFPPVDGAINAYYVPTLEASLPTSTGPVIINPSGHWCKDDPNIVLIGLFGPETLAHELGHALSLHHLAASDNIMFDSRDVRTWLTTGQAFRMNVSDVSRVNKNNVRTGPKRDCSSGCPAETFDVLPR